MKKLLLALAIIFLPTIAFAQMWQSYPQVDGPSFCNSTVNAVCVQTVPAGPALTGNETIPGDTNLTGGGQPQTVKIDIQSLGGGKTVLVVPVTTDTITVDAQTRQLLVNPAGTIAALTINFPAASSTMLNGQRIGVCGSQIVTTLTMSAGTGNTFNTTAPTAMLVPVVTGAASCFEFIYIKTSATVGVWFRTQ